MRDRPHVVLVDDDEVDALMLRKAFARAAVDVEFEHLISGPDLLARCVASNANSKSSNTLPDAVLLDINMPAMDGFEVLRRLRKSDVCSAVPVVMFTTSNLHQDIEQSYLAGANSYMVKPSSIDDLISLARGFYNYWFTIVALPKIEN